MHTRLSLVTSHLYGFRVNMADGVCTVSFVPRLPHFKSDLGTVWLPARLIISRIKQGLVYLESVKGTESPN